MFLGDLGTFKINGLEPMRIDDINLERGRGFFVALTNTLAYKISNFKTEKLRINPDNLQMDLIINVPNVSIKESFIKDVKF